MADAVGGVAGDVAAAGPPGSSPLPHAATASSTATSTRPTTRALRILPRVTFGDAASPTCPVRYGGAARTGPPSAGIDRPPAEHTPADDHAVAPASRFSRSSGGPGCPRATSKPVSKPESKPVSKPVSKAAEAPLSPLTPHPSSLLADRRRAQPPMVMLLTLASYDVSGIHMTPTVGSLGSLGGGWHVVRSQIRLPPGRPTDRQQILSARRSGIPAWRGTA